MKSYMKEPAILLELQALLENNAYHTSPGYSINTTDYPDHVVPFIEEHINYLKRHPQIDPAHYLSNLRLMLKIQ